MLACKHVYMIFCNPNSVTRYASSTSFLGCLSFFFSVFNDLAQTSSYDRLTQQTQSVSQNGRSCVNDSLIYWSAIRVSTSWNEPDV